MAAVVGKYAANKLLSAEMKKHANKNVTGDNDPFYFYVEDPRRPGKPRKVKKKAPEYIPEHDREILDTFRRRAFRLDVGLFNFCGIRFGWEAVIGIIPFVGDAIGVSMALLLMKQAMKVTGGLPQTIKLRMMINIALDFIVGLVPFVGDLADAAFKCNTRNLRLLEKHLDNKYKPSSSAPDARAAVSAAEKKRRAQNRRSGVYHYGEYPPAAAPEPFDEHDTPGPTYEELPQDRIQPTAAKPKARGWRSLFEPGPQYQPPDAPMAETARPGTGNARR